MMLIRTYLKSSELHGIGCYASQLIPKGTAVWEYNEVIDRVIDYDWFLNAPKSVQEDILFYGEWEGEYFVLCGDHGKFFNHDEEKCNLQLVEVDDTWRLIAKKDIQEDGELLYDYNYFQNHVFQLEGKLFPITNLKKPEKWNPRKRI